MTVGELRQQLADLVARHEIEDDSEVLLPGFTYDDADDGPPQPLGQLLVLGLGRNKAELYLERR